MLLADVSHFNMHLETLFRLQRRGKKACMSHNSTNGELLFESSVVIWTEGWTDTLWAVWEVEFVYGPLPLHSSVVGLQVKFQHIKQQ